MSEITFEINNEILELYKEYYFNRYPRRRKFPIKRPIPLSLNQWMIMGRPQANNIKGKWAEFGEFVIRHYGLNDLNINKCSVEIVYYFPTKRLADLDNLTPKHLLDSFVSAGLITDDNYNVINPLIIRGEYRKKNPGTKFTFFVEGYDDEKNKNL